MRTHLIALGMSPRSDSPELVASQAAIMIHSVPPRPAAPASHRIEPCRAGKGSASNPSVAPAP